MKRFAFNFAALLSAIAFACLAVLLVTSFFTSARIGRQWNANGSSTMHGAGVDLHVSQLCFYKEVWPSPTPQQGINPGWHIATWSAYRRRFSPPVRTRGMIVQIVTYEVDLTYQYKQVIAETWVFALLALPLPVIWLRRWRKNRTSGQGFAVLAADEKQGL